jgi:hypothetical protein
MTPDPLSALIAALRELVQTMYPAIDLVEHMAAEPLYLNSGQGRAMAQTRLEQLCGNDGVWEPHEAPDVPARSALPNR